MKKVKEILYEKFEKESDPIKDMDIGGIDFYDEYIERYKQEENRLYKEWQEFVMQTIQGKWVSGVMDRYERGKYTAKKITNASILAKKIVVGRDGLINLETDFATYHLLPSERYKISDK